MMSEERKGTTDAKAGLKPSQVTAAALAAVTAAFLGSTLGVAGTVVGAGIASVVSTVGGELYLRSLSKTKEAAQRTKEAALALADSSTREQAGPVQQPPHVSGQRMAGYHPNAQNREGRRNDMRLGAGTQWGQRQPAYHRAPGPSTGRPVDGDPTVLIPRLNLESPVEGAETGNGQARRRYSLRWPLIIGTSVVGFVIAILAITGFEGVIGKSISGDDVTTVGHLWTGGGSGQPDTPPTTGNDDNVQPSQSRVPTTTTPQNDGEKRPTTSGSTPSMSVPKSSAPSTSVPESSAPSTSVPKSSNTPRTPSSLPSNGNNAPGGGDQRRGSDGASGTPRPNVQ